MAFAQSIEEHHRPIIVVLALIIVAMVASCIFDDLIPSCHLLFGCDHAVHAA